jgi:hypothetical protein
MKLSIKRFDPTEPFKGLGTNFGECGLKFMCQIAIAKIKSGFCWKDEHNIDCLSSNLEDKALRYFENQSPICMKEWTFLEHVMMMHKTYNIQLTLKQAVNIFQRPVPKTRTWAEHYVYLVEVSHAAGGLPKPLLESIVKYASPEMHPTLLVRANTAITD